MCNLLSAPKTANGHHAIAGRKQWHPITGRFPVCSSPAFHHVCRPNIRRSYGEDAARNAQITVLYDAFGKASTMQKDWGYAALIEYGGKRILFDTGNNPEILAQNVKASGVDLTKLDFVVMSHRHGDHMGGLPYLLKVNPTVKIYAPKEGLGVYGSDLPSSFYRKDASLPQDQRYFDGAPPEIIRFGSAWPGATFSLWTRPRKLLPISI